MSFLPFFSPTPYSDADADSSMSSSHSYLFASAPPPPPPPALQPVLTTTSCDSVLLSHSEGKLQGSSRRGLGVAAGGRAGKRRPRASKRAPTTYISTDPANFRLMVQHVTGAQLLDDVQAPVFDADHPLLPPAPADNVVDAAELRQFHQQQHYQQRQQEPCFPTLDSWSVMYESSELAAALVDH